MALSPVTADVVAQNICTALSITDPTTVSAWKTIIEQIYAGLKTDIVITILPASIVTVGGPATQTGPAAPIPLSPA